MGIGSTIMMQSMIKSDTANEKKSSSVFTHFVIKSIAEVHQAEKLPLHAKMNDSMYPPVHMATIAITDKYMTLWRFLRLVLSTTKILR
jgi:hypothetical protein